MLEIGTKAKQPNAEFDSLAADFFARMTGKLDVKPEHILIACMGTKPNKGTERVALLICCQRAAEKRISDKIVGWSAKLHFGHPGGECLTVKMTEKIV